MKEPRQFLNEVLNERMASNPGYSMRAFARDLSLSSQQLSNVLRGRRGISEKTAEVIASKLGLNSRQKEIFCQGVRANFSRSKSQRAIAKARLEHFHQRAFVTESLELDVLRTLSSWYHFALIELIKIAKSNRKQNHSSWFSKKLGISENEVVNALSRLERLKIISKTIHGWKIKQASMVIDKGVSTEDVKSFHRQVLEKSIQALAFQSSDERYGYSGTLPIKIKNIPRARELIREFKDCFSEEIADQDDAEEVYGLSIQFFRLTEKESR